MINDLNKFAVLTIVLSLLVASCGLGASNEERVRRAEQQVETGEYRAAMIELKNVLASDANNVRARLLLAKVSLGLGDALAAEKELLRAADLNALASEIGPLHMEILLAKGKFSEMLAAIGMQTAGLTQEQQWRFRSDALSGLANFESAKDTYKEWLAEMPQSVDAAVGIANSDAMMGKLDEAVGSLQALAQTRPAEFSVWHSLGIAQIRLGDYQGAAKSLGKSRDLIKPQSDILRYGSILAALAEAQLILDDQEAARQSIERLNSLLPNFPATLMLAARLERASGNYALASRHLQSLLNIDPDNVRAQLFLATLQMLQGNLAQAENLLQRVIAAAPDNIQARKLLARIQLDQAHPSVAVEVLAPLLNSQSSDPNLYKLLAQASLQQGDTAKAISRLKTAAVMAPNDMNAKLNLAAAYIEAGEVGLSRKTLDSVPVGAGNSFRRERLMMEVLVRDGEAAKADSIADGLLRSTESKALAASIVAEHFLKTDRTEKAKVVLRKAIGEEPSELGSKVALGRIELAEGKLAAARKLFTDVLESEPSNLHALVGMASVHFAADETQEMIHLLNQAAQKHARAIEPRILLSHYNLSEGNLPEAERSANELVAIGFQNADISAVVGDVFAAAGRNEDALAQFQQAARIRPDSAEIQLGLARAYLATDHSVEAREALQSALASRPNWPPALTILALVEIRQGRLEEASRLAREFRSSHPNNVSGMVLEGEVLFAQQDFGAAAVAFRRATAGGAGRSSALREYQALVSASETHPERTLQDWLKNNPDDTAVRSFLAQHYLQNQEGPRAVAEYEEVLRHDPQNAVILNNLAWQYQQEGDLQRAAELAEKAHSINPNSGSVADTLGWIYYEMGNMQKSLELLGSAKSLAPDNGEIQYHYAAALSKSGDNAAARRILQQLLTINNNFASREDARKLLDQL